MNTALTDVRPVKITKCELKTKSSRYNFNESRFRFSKQNGTASETAPTCEEKNLLSEGNGGDEGIIFDYIRFSQSEGRLVIHSVIHTTLCLFKCKCGYGKTYCLRYIENTSTDCNKENIYSTAKSLRAIES